MDRSDRPRPGNAHPSQGHRRQILEIPRVGSGRRDAPHALDHGLVGAIGEDVVATAYLEEMIEGVGGDPSELRLHSDHICLRGRRMFEHMILAEKTAADQKAPAFA
jgi:hypothetical protein